MQAFSFIRWRSFAAFMFAVMGGGTLPALAYGWVTAEHIRIGEAIHINPQLGDTVRVRNGMLPQAHRK
jgi:hypothetical protein